MSLEIETLRAFVKVAELQSFTRAAEQLRAPKARVSQQVQRLESELGCLLLHRTTRTVRTTPEGDRLLGRARALVLEAEDVSVMFAATASLRGRVRIDLPINIARNLVIPRLPQFFSAHPEVEVQLSTTDRLVDVVREGFDCVLRVGALADSELVAIPLGALAMTSCASAAYVRAHGKPKTPADLDRHLLVHYSASLGGDAPVFEWSDLGQTRRRRMRCLVTVNNADAFVAACVAGLGIIQVPVYGVRERLAEGELIELLPRFRAPALPVTLLHAHGARVPRRVRVTMDWLASLLRPYLNT